MNEQRINLSKVTPEIRAAMGALEQTLVEQCERVGLEPELRELIKMRASQINGCAFCISMHTVDAREIGMSEYRIDLLPAWRETELYSARERAALALIEAVTYVHDGHVPDEVWQEAAQVFPEAELGVLVWAAATINTWNRIAITSRTPVPGR